MRQKNWLLKFYNIGQKLRTLLATAFALQRENSQGTVADGLRRGMLTCGRMRWRAVKRS